ncbi:N-acetylmannosamine kinase [uncultured archaeon]|nr:N-acetylmannosamine kinase [uncultured archaeon]
MADAAVFVGVDAGATFIRPGLLRGGSFVLGEPVDSKAALGANAYVHQIKAAVDGLLAREGVDDSVVSGFCVAVPGPVSFDGRVSLPNVVGVGDFDMRHVLRAAFGSRVFLINDADASALGAAEHINVRRLRVNHGGVLTVTLGTGVGGGFVLPGKELALLSGYEGVACELGHMKVVDEPFKCGCGATGCLETVASGNGIVRVAKARLKEALLSTLPEAFGGLSGLAAASRTSPHKVAEAVFSAASGGDPLATRVLRSASFGGFLPREKLRDGALRDDVISYEAAKAAFHGRRCWLLALGQVDGEDVSAAYRRGRLSASDVRGRVDGIGFTSFDVDRLAVDGDGLCQDVLFFAASVLGGALADVAGVLNPEVIAVTGGLTDLRYREFFRTVEESFQRRVFSPAARVHWVKLRPHEHVGVSGAVRYAQLKVAKK